MANHIGVQEKDGSGQKSVPTTNRHQYGNLNLEKFGLPRFKLVFNNGEDKPHPSSFEHLKGKAVVSEEMNLCAKCQKEISNITKRLGAYEQENLPTNAINFHPFRGKVKPFYGRQHNSFQGIRTFRPQPQCPNVWHSYNSRIGRAIPFNEMTRTQQRRF
ncbi:hypothetical protein Adt_39357 [Abeliophyllum distichum]|uniref:Uncharacterized protein n=1 Tax=Abeliophyllum distichum TaxID=126358 RepID=A0ABD1Q923_9LAMI